MTLKLELCLSKIVQEVDYDIWKEMFPNDSNEEEVDEVSLDNLFRIVRKHIP